MSLHRTCCCGGEPSRLWLKPSCNDNPPSTVIVFEQNDCNLILNSQLYEYDDGAFSGPLKYCGVLRREVDFPIPGSYQERIVDSTDCGDINTITCGDCYDDLCGYWDGCETAVIVDGYTDTGWQFPDDGFGPNTNWRARVTGVNIGASTFVSGAAFTGWEYDITVDTELETLESLAVRTSPVRTSVMSNPCRCRPTAGLRRSRCESPVMVVSLLITIIKNLKDHTSAKTPTLATVRATLCRTETSRS